jgi:hypothetical protein
MSKKRHVRLVEMDDKDPFEDPSIHQNGMDVLPPALDALAMDDLSDIEMKRLTALDDEEDVDEFMMISRELDFFRNRLSTMETTIRRRRCIPCGVRLLWVLVAILIIGLVVNYGFDFSHVILAFAHEKGWL